LGRKERRADTPNTGVWKNRHAKFVRRNTKRCEMH
jgi:hypothetical protein